MEYIPRLADKELMTDLRIFGAVVIVGPKWVGKTTTAARVSGSILRMQDPEMLSINLEMAAFKPSKLLEGMTPRLIDEWQEAPQLWDAVRLAVDDRNEPGQFILTGSTVADRKDIRHSGTGRFCELKMGTLTLFESGDSDGSVSLRNLFDGGIADAISNKSAEDMAYLVVRGGWPKTIGRDTATAMRIVTEYCNSITGNDAIGSPSRRYDRSKFSAVLRSLSRSISAPLSKSGIITDISTMDSSRISENTLNSYLDELRRIYLLDELHAWCPNLRSKTAVRVADTVHFCDPAIAARFLSASPKDLLNDLRTFGLLFESLVVRDLRVYARALDGEVFHYRDKNGLEADAIIHLNDGRWAAIEVKLGDAWVDEAARNLKKLADNVDTDRMGRPAFLAVVTATRYAYTRPDGVHVIPLAVLGP